MEELKDIFGGLNTFYSFPNELDTEKLSDSSMTLISEMESRLNKSRRALLPAVVDGSIRWYGIAPTNIEARKLGEEIDGWLGTPISYRITDFNKYGLDSDVIDQRAVELSNGGVTYRVEVGNEWKKKARQNVETLLQLWAIAPTSNVESHRSLGQILGEFFASLASSNRKRSEALLDELKGKAMITATNQRFLKIALLHKFQDFEAIISDTELRDISFLKMPQAVTESISDAINGVFIAPHEDFDNVNLAQIAKQIESRSAFVMDRSSNATSVNVARCMLLQEVYINKSQDVGLIKRVSQYNNDPLVSAICSDLMQRQTNATQSDDLDPIPDHEKLEYKFTSKSIESLLVDIRNAIDSGSFQRISAAREKYAAVPVAVKELISNFTPYQQLIAELEEFQVDGQVPSDWIDWLERPFNVLSDQLFDWSRSWKRDQESIELLNSKWAIELISATEDVQRSNSVIDGLGVFVEWITRDGLPPSCTGICADTVYVLLTSTSSIIYRDLSLKLIDELLSVGCTERVYSELINSVSAALRKLGPRDVSWVIRIMETFYVSSTPSPEKRQVIANEVIELSKKWHDRITSVDSFTLGLLFSEFLDGYPQIRLKDDVELQTLKTKPIKATLIYTLLESAGKAAADWIESQFSGIKVRVSSDHVNSDSLSSMVKSSDLVIVQTSHAKHAATKAIDEAVRSKDRLVRVDGKGTSSIIRTFLNWIYDL